MGASKFFMFTHEERISPRSALLRRRFGGWALQGQLAALHKERRLVLERKCTQTESRRNSYCSIYNLREASGLDENPKQLTNVWRITIF